LKKQTQEQIKEMLRDYTLPHYPVNSFLLKVLIIDQNGNCSKIEEYKLFLLKEKTIFHNLNKLKMQNMIYTGRCWIPKYQKERVYKALSDMTKVKIDIAGAQL